MTVKDAIKMMSYGTCYEIRGAYSGKVYHRSYSNNSKNLEKYYDRELSDTPFYADVRIRGTESNHWCIAVIVIWMFDYDLVSGADMRGNDNG